MTGHEPKMQNKRQALQLLSQLAMHHTCCALLLMLRYRRSQYIEQWHLLQES